MDRNKTEIQVDEEDIKCIKCKKNCKSRGSFCSYGSHWVHYNCERLTKEEIMNIEKCKDEDYRCKICINTSPNKITLKIPAIKPLSPEQKGDLIEEEIITHESSFDSEENDQCAVCGEVIESPVAELCDSCESPCHADCMYSENTCIYCQESLNQDEMIEVMSSSMLPCQTSQTSSVNLDSQSNNDSQKPKSSHKSKCTQTNIKGEELDLKEVKLSELRNKESKLRKMEEELKLKEKSFEDKDKDRLKLELYVKKLESRVQELELTIKTLKQQSDTPKAGASHDQHQQLPNNPINEQFNEQVMNIHKRVTSIVIKQIDIQLNKLEESLVNTDDKKSESITSSHNNMEHERVGYNTNVSNRNYDMNTNRTNVNSLHKNFEIGRDNTQNGEDEDCYIVTPENITSTLKGKPVNSKYTSNFQQRRNANDRPKNSVFNKDKRRQSSTFMNIPNKCMTKSLAREKYKQSVACNVEQKSNTNQNTNYEHIQNETIHENQSEIESHHFLDMEETIIDLK